MLPVPRPWARTWRRLRDRMLSLDRTQTEPISIHPSRIYLMPTRAGMLLALTLLSMVLGSINYALSLGLVLAFVIGGVTLAGAMHGFRNLLRLEISLGRSTPVFCADKAAFVVLIANPRQRERIGLECVFESNRAGLSRLPPLATAPLTLEVPTHQRGWLRLPWIKLQTRYPMGLVNVWAYVRPAARVLVWPRPEPSPPPPPRVPGASGQSLSAGQGAEDFSSLRAHQPSDSLRHVAWKVLAREGPMLVKQFSGTAGGPLRLDWAQLPAELGLEHKLSRLTAWVCEAHRADTPWQLITPEVDLGPARGAAHYHACLTALALHGHAKD